MVWTTLSASLCMLPLALVAETGVVPTTAYGWAMVLGLALVSHVGGQGLIAYALAYLPAAFSSLTLLLQPVVAALLAWFLLGEPLGRLKPWAAPSCCSASSSPDAAEPVAHQDRLPTPPTTG